MADWLGRVQHILKLNQRGVLVLVDGARVDHLPALLRALDGAVPVCFEPWELEALPAGSTAVFVPAATHAAELNAARLLFADRALRVIVWAERGVSAALARGAPDFFDWISHRVECPRGLATFFVEGVRLARAVGVGGVLVSEPYDARRDAPPIGDLADEDDAAAGELAWYDETDLGADWRIELALAAPPGLPVVGRNTSGPVDEPGWWWLDHRPIDTVRGLIGDAHVTRRQLLLLGGEPSALAMVQRVAEHSRQRGDFRRPVVSNALIALALKLGLVTRDALFLGTAPPLLRRAFFGSKAQPRRVMRSWPKRATAPAGWQVMFAPEELLSRSGDDPTDIGVALVEHYIRHDQGERFFHDDRAVRAVDGLDGQRAEVLAWLGDAVRAERDSPRGTLLRALEQIARDDLHAARVLLEVTLNQRAIDLSTYVAAMTAHVRLLATLGEFKPALTGPSTFEFRERTLDDADLRREAEALDGDAVAEWLYVRARCALDDHNIDLARTLLRDLRGLTTRPHAGERARTRPLDIEARLALARGATARALEHLDALASASGAPAPPALLAAAHLQSGDAKAALELLRRSARPRRPPPLGDAVFEALIRGRAALGVGDVELAEATARSVVERVERAIGDASVSAAEITQLKAEVALARGRYAEAEGLAARAAQVFRERLDPSHPTRIENELFRKIVPGQDPEPGAALALDHLARVLGNTHPSVDHWRRRVEAAVVGRRRREHP